MVQDFMTHLLSSCSADIAVTALSDKNEVCIITKGKELPHTSLLANLPPEPFNQNHLGPCNATPVPFQSNHLCRPVQASQTIFFSRLSQVLTPPTPCPLHPPTSTPLSLVQLCRPLSPSSTHLPPSLPRLTTLTTLTFIHLPRPLSPSSDYVDHSNLHPPTSPPRPPTSTPLSLIHLPQPLPPSSNCLDPSLPTLIKPSISSIKQPLH